MTTHLATNAPFLQSSAFVPLSLALFIFSGSGHFLFKYVQGTIYEFSERAAVCTGHNLFCREGANNTFSDICLSFSTTRRRDPRLPLLRPSCAAFCVILVCFVSSSRLFQTVCFLHTLHFALRTEPAARGGLWADLLRGSDYRCVMTYR